MFTYVHEAIHRRYTVKHHSDEFFSMVYCAVMSRMCVSACMQDASRAFSNGATDFFFAFRCLKIVKFEFSSLPIEEISHFYPFLLVLVQNC